MLDIGQDFTQINPAWYDTLRVTKLPSSEKEFGEDNSTFAGVRQSRLGFKSSSSTSMGALKTIFEFELFGTGVDEGQTTFRLRHAWGELGQFGAGQYWSPFTDPDIFPNSLDGVFVYALTAAVLGGLDNPLGTIIGGVGLGVGLSYVSGYLGPELVTLASLAILVVVLAVRPNGLFGKALARSV